jgi:multidrug efflux pump subunit AcrA (membrane-fusion protein)
MSKFKKHKWKIIIGVVVVLIIVIAVKLIGFNKKKNQSAEMNVMSSQAETGSISSTVSGTGNITLSETKDIKLPTGIKITKVYVEAGDTVKKGDKLVKVDKASVLAALVEAKEELSDVKSEKSASGTSSLKKEELALEQENLEDLIATLKTLRSSQIVKATADGIIGSVNVSDDSEVSASASSTSGNSSGFATQSSTANNSASVLKLSNTKKTSGGFLSLSTTSEEGISKAAADTTEETTEETTETTTEKTTEATTENNTESKASGSSKKTESKQQTVPSSGSKAVSGSSASGANNSSSGTSSATSTSTASSVDTTQATVVSILLQDKATVTISIDELDILSLEEGQEATVTLDAVEDQEYTGEITKISGSASSTSGNAKYDVQISIDMDSQMKSGMSASATITTGSASQAVLIPVNALQEKDGKTFVYTENNNGQLSGEVEVTTGISDSSRVAITSGLSEGDTVYYTRSGSSDSSDMDMKDMFQNGGGMKGDMPSGGGQGGGPGMQGGGSK